MWTELLGSDKDANEEKGKKDKWRVFLMLQEFRALLTHAYSEGECSLRAVRIQIRLTACSLRRGTVARLKYSQFYRREWGRRDPTFPLRDQTEVRRPHSRERGSTTGATWPLSMRMLRRGNSGRVTVGPSRKPRTLS